MNLTTLFFDCSQIHDTNSPLQCPSVHFVQNRNIFDSLIIQLFLKYFFKIILHFRWTGCKSKVRKRREKYFYFSDKNSTRNNFFLFSWINFQYTVERRNKKFFLKKIQFRMFVMQIALIDYVIMIAPMWSQFSLCLLPFGFKCAEEIWSKAYFTPPRRSVFHFAKFI